MKRPYRIAIPFLLVIAGFVIITLVALREPSYRGRTLNSWLKQCWDTPLDQTDQLAEAQNAVRAIGATNALPTLLKLAAAHDGPIRSWIITHNEKWNIRFLRLEEALHKQMLAVAGFEVLGTNCSPAVPGLTRMLDDTNHAFTAVRCLSEVGKAAEFAMCRGLTNQNPEVRRWSVLTLAAMTDDVEEYVNRLKPLLKDREGMVQYTVLEAIGDQTQAPDLAVPILATALAEDSSLAARLLANFGTNALVTFTALSNAVDHGSSETARQALRTLVTIAPHAALPMVLAQLHSPEPHDQVSALGLLHGYAATNSEILPALELAAAAASLMVSQPARMILTDLYQARHSEESLFPNEPLYAGKRLGEWLKQRHDGIALSKEAQSALGSMGTNAIPALLYRLTYKKPPYDLPAFDVNIEAVAAFMVLGEQAKPALPRLERLMDSDDAQLALHAMLATTEMGAESVRCLIKGMSSQHADVRNGAVHHLTDGAATRFAEERKAAVPILTKLLNDTNEFVQLNAKHVLKQIDPKAAALAGIK